MKEIKAQMGHQLIKKKNAFFGSLDSIGTSAATSLLIVSFQLTDLNQDATKRKHAKNANYFYFWISAATTPP